MYGNRLVATSAHFPAIEIDVRSWLLGIRIRFIVGPSASRNLALSYDEARLPTGSMLTNYLRLGPFRRTFLWVPFIFRRLLQWM